MSPPDAVRVADIIRKAATVYTPEGVGVWLLGKNKMLDNRTPLELIETFDFDRLEASIDAAAEGTFV